MRMTRCKLHCGKANRALLSELDLCFQRRKRQVNLLHQRLPHLPPAGVLDKDCSLNPMGLFVCVKFVLKVKNTSPKEIPPNSTKTNTKINDKHKHVQMPHFSGGLSAHRRTYGNTRKQTQFQIGRGRKCETQYETLRREFVLNSLVLLQKYTAQFFYFQVVLYFFIQ